jgi:hypothetical protein
MIQRQLLQHSENGEDVVTHLWEPMSVQIIAIVGEGGFNSLYARTLSLNKTAFSWLATSPLPPKNYQRFTELKMCLEGQTTAQIREANHFLLITFTDILASLIGEHLTSRILELAWDTGTALKTDKEFTKHE